jgi:hypothetical protein
MRYATALVGFRNWNKRRVERILQLFDAYLSGASSPITRLRAIMLKREDNMHAPYRSVSYLTVLCPTTQSSISTTIATDVRTLAKAWHRKIKVSCPHCMEIHNYRVSEAFVETALSNGHLRGELTIISDPNSPHASPPAQPDS